MASRYGRYEVLYKLGQGAMAQVFLARDPILSRFVAIKVLHAELASRKDVLQRFFNEARTVAVVRNPHVVEVFDFGQEGKDLYLVMEFVDGLSLRSLLKRLRPDQGVNPGREDWEGDSRDASPFFEPLDPVVTSALMCQAAEGLTLAARHGVVHRDIKPENLMINQQGYLKISDFGIAHVQDDSITKTGAVLGSPLYMSPEQAKGLKPITYQADIFSLGAVFYSCLAGHPPFQGRSLTDLFRKIALEPHAPLGRLRPGLDPALGGLVDILLRKNPAERGGGPSWLHRQLKLYLMSLGIMDPAALIGAYLEGLPALGFQTTEKMDPPGPRAPATLPDLSRPGPGPVSATERYTRDGRRRMPMAFPGAVLGMLALAAVGGAIWGFLHRSPGVKQTLAASAPGSTRNLADTGASGTGFGDGAGRHGAEAVPEHPPADSASDPSVLALAGPVPDTLVRPSDQDSQALSGPGPGGVKPEPAVLILKSSPPFAEAYVDGRFAGVTPLRVALPAAGRHRVVLKVGLATAFDTVLILEPGAQTYKFRTEAGVPSRVAVTQEDFP